MLDKADDELRDFAAAFAERDRFAKTLGIVFDDVGPGRANARMRVRPDMANALGTCHGGVIFTLADTVFAVACNGRGRPAVAQFCSIAYMRPVAVGDELTAVGAETIAAGQRAIYDVTVACRGEVVAAFRGHARAVEERSVPT
jgi:acyl-CoA thioesterase